MPCSRSRVAMALSSSKPRASWIMIRVFPVVILAGFRQIFWDFPLARHVILLARNAAHVNCNDVSLLPVSGIIDHSIPGGSHRTQSLVALL